MKHSLQLFELIITSFLFAFIVANIVEIWKPDLWLSSAIISFIVWFTAGLRYVKLKNEMMKYKPKKISIHPAFKIRNHNYN